MRQQPAYPHTTSLLQESLERRRIICWTQFVVQAMTGTSFVADFLSGLPAWLLPTEAPSHAGCAVDLCLFVSFTATGIAQNSHPLPALPLRRNRLCFCANARWHTGITAALLAATVLTHNKKPLSAYKGSTFEEFRHILRPKAGLLVTFGLWSLLDARYRETGQVKRAIPDASSMNATILILS